jgi:hypothetical protein
MVRLSGKRLPGSLKSENVLNQFLIYVKLKITDT